MLSAVTGSPNRLVLGREYGNLLDGDDYGISLFHVIIPYLEPVSKVFGTTIFFWFVRVAGIIGDFSELAIALCGVYGIDISLGSTCCFFAW